MEPTWTTMNNRKSCRDRVGSEDIPAVVQELLKDLPSETQTILRVDDNYPFDSNDKKEAEEQFLNNKNTNKLLQDSKNCYDYIFLRQLLKKSPLDSVYTSRKFSEANKNRPVVEVSHRSYEEEFLREPKQNERPCVKGDNCEGLFISTTDKGFVLREYLLPSQYKTFLQTNTLPSCPQLCLLCRRAAVTRMYVNYRADGDACSNGAIISDIRNYVAVTGEYCLDQCLLPTGHQYVGLYDPVVHHVRKHLVAKRISGIRYYKQVGYRYPDAGKSLHFLS